MVPCYLQGGGAFICVVEIRYMPVYMIHTGSSEADLVLSLFFAGFFFQRGREH
jgi:hypothetical protein